MSEALLRPSDDIGQADWIRSRLAPFSSYTVSIVVPGGFPAYVRVFHPAYAQGWEDRPTRWADVATWAGTTMYELAQFAWLAAPQDEAREHDEWDGSDPDTGNLDPEVLSALSEILGRHTGSPQLCWFCVWAGYGWRRPLGKVTVFPVVGRAAGPPAPPPGPPEPARVAALPEAVLEGYPQVKLPGREYWLFVGPLEGALEAADLCGATLPRQSPNLFWPDDRAWCVATEIDLDSTYIGGSEALIEAICADPRLEAWRVEPDDPITKDSDWINGGDGDPPPR